MFKSFEYCAQTNWIYWWIVRVLFLTLSLICNLIEYRGTENAKDPQWQMSDLRFQSLSGLPILSHHNDFLSCFSLIILI